MIYERQRANGPCLLHEHPRLETNLVLKCLVKVESYDDVQNVLTDMCQFGVVRKAGGVGSALGNAVKPPRSKLHEHRARD